MDALGGARGLHGRRFADFEANLDISKNILSARLEHLVGHGVLARVDAGVRGTRYEYESTPMGKDLATLMTALQQWAIAGSTAKDTSRCWCSTGVPGDESRGCASSTT